MTTEGTLADPPGVSSCVICDGPCVHFQEAPYPETYPFLPGGYDKRGDQNVQPRPIVGERKQRRMRWRS